MQTQQALLLRTQLVWLLQSQDLNQGGENSKAVAILRQRPVQGGGKSMAATAVLSTTDHTRGIYVIPIAKAIGRLGSDTLAFAPLEAEEKPVAEHVQHDRLPCSYHPQSPPLAFSRPFYA